LAERPAPKTLAEEVVDGEGTVGEGERRQAISTATHLLDQIALVHRVPVSRDTLAGEVDEPDLGDTAASVVRHLTAAVEGQRRVGNFDDQEDVLSRRMPLAVVGTPNEGEIGLGQALGTNYSWVLNADDGVVPTSQDEQLIEAIDRICMLWPDRRHLDYLALDQLEVGVLAEHAELAHSDELLDAEAVRTG
jgi:hypothetical protein